MLARSYREFLVDSEFTSSASSGSRQNARISSENQIFERIFDESLGSQELNSTSNEQQQNQSMTSTIIKCPVNGLNREQFKKIKRMKMEKSSKVCSICWQNFQEKQIIRILPCMHIFHEKCILPWLTKHTNCPNCRFDIKEYLQQQQENC